MSQLVEDRVRAAMRAAAEKVREVRPLDLPAAGPPARRARIWHIWLAPVSAAAAVLALVISLVIVRDMPNEHQVPATGSPLSLAVPEYYMALPGADNFGNVPGATQAVLIDTFSGKRLLTLKPSGGEKFVSVTAAADDRTFVLGAARNLQPPAVPMATTWYLVHVTPGSAVHATMSKLRIPAPPPGGMVFAAALSPDGRKLATIGIQSQSPASAVVAGIYSAATGALLHAWSGPLNLGFGAYTTLSWTADGYQVAIGYGLNVRMLGLTSTGHDLVADSRLVWSIKGADTSSFSRTSPFSCTLALRALVTADGKTVVCSASGVFRVPRLPSGGAVCPAIPPWADMGFLEYSTATGKLARTLYKDDTNCVPGYIDVLWTSASGGTVIGYFRLGDIISEMTGHPKPVIRFGIFSNNKFTPLPLPPTTTTTPNAIAW